MKRKKQLGIGLEMEGFIINGSGAKERIAGLPASEWVLNRIRKTVPQLADNLSMEQASVMLEIKSDVFGEEELAVRQILEIRSVVDEILKKAGCRLIFQPVLERDFEFVAASSDPNSRTQQLISEWGRTPHGVQMLKATAIASLQVNDSRPYEGVESRKDQLDLARQIHNLYSTNFPELNSGNGKLRDHRGKTRMEKLFFLLPEVKKEAFAKHGYCEPIKAALPGEFATVDEMTRWMMAHSDVSRFEDAKCKNEHAVTVKIKRTGPTWICESRVYDAVDSEKEILAIVRQNNNLLAQLNT